MSEVCFIEWCFIPVLFIASLVAGIFALLNWQNASVDWACPIVFILGVVLLILAGMLLAIWIILFAICESDDEALK